MGRSASRAVQGGCHFTRTRLKYGVRPYHRSGHLRIIASHIRKPLHDHCHGGYRLNRFLPEIRQPQERNGHGREYWLFQQLAPFIATFQSFCRLVYRANTKCHSETALVKFFNEYDRHCFEADFVWNQYLEHQPAVFQCTQEDPLAKCQSENLYERVHSTLLH